MDWISFRQFPINKQLTNTKGEMPRISPEVSIEVDGVVAMCQMAKSGLGIAAVPKVVVQDDLDRGRPHRSQSQLAPKANFSLCGVAEQCFGRKSDTSVCALYGGQDEQRKVVVARLKQETNL